MIGRVYDYAEWRDNNVKHGQEPKLVWKTGDKNLARFRVDADSSGQHGQRMQGFTRNSGQRARETQGTAGEVTTFNTKKVAWVSG